MPDTDDESPHPVGVLEFSRVVGTIDGGFGFIAVIVQSAPPKTVGACMLLRCRPAITGVQGEWLDLASDKEQKTPTRKSSPTKVQSRDRDMGSALRSAYQKTVDEQVPDEMLDLLSKLA